MYFIISLAAVFRYWFSKIHEYLKQPLIRKCKACLQFFAGMPRQASAALPALSPAIDIALQLATLKQVLQNSLQKRFPTYFFYVACASYVSDVEFMGQFMAFNSGMLFCRIQRHIHPGSL